MLGSPPNFTRCLLERHTSTLLDTHFMYYQPQLIDQSCLPFILPNDDARRLETCQPLLCAEGGVGTRGYQTFFHWQVDRPI